MITIEVLFKIINCTTLWLVKSATAKRFQNEREILMGKFITKSVC